MKDDVSTAAQRIRNPWGQGERLRLEILRAASQLLSELGGEQAVTIRGVARTLGIAPASIYQHFSDKAALLTDLIQYDAERLAAAMQDAVAGLGQDPVAALHAQLRAYCRFALDNRGHYRLMLTNCGEPEQEPRRQSLTPIVRSVTESLRRCESAERQLRVPVDRAAVILFVGIHGRVALFHSDPTDEDTGRVLAFVDELTGLILADPSPGPRGRTAGPRSGSPGGK